MKYRLEIDEKQLFVIQAACELLARLTMGKLTEIGDLFVNSISNDDLKSFKEQIKTLEPLVTGLPSNRYHGIRGSSISENARIAYDIHQVLRHHLALVANREGGICISVAPPFATSTSCQLNQIESIQEINK